MAPAGTASAASVPRRGPFAIFWLLATALLLWPLLHGQHGFDLLGAGPGLLALLASTFALIRPLPLPSVPGERTRRLPFALALGLLALALFGAYALLGKALIFCLPVLALAVLCALRPAWSRRGALYVLALGAVAAVAGLGAGWLTFTPVVWGALQLPLVALGLPAGWAILARAGLLARGVGVSIYLTQGALPAARAFAAGSALSLPWALANVVLGGADRDTWARDWWAPVVAIQPGIAEEAWARVLLVGLALAALRPFGTTRTALTWAVLLVGYWFAFLHTQGGLGGVPSALLIGTLYSLPLSFLWLGRGLEMAMGFHFAVDAVRFLCAFLLNAGLWVP